MDTKMDCMFCPECLAEKKEFTPIIKRRLSFKQFILLCNKCSFAEICDGELLLTKDEAVKYGFPGEFVDHFPLKMQHVTQILLLAFHQHLSSEKMTLPALNEDLSNIENILSSNIHNDSSVQHRLSTKPLNDPAQTYEELQQAVIRQCGNIIEPQMKELVLEAFAKVTHFKFPDDFIAHHIRI